MKLNMGTPDYIYDDVVIIADSADVVDHYQDGYNIYNATLFYGRWFNGSHTTNQAGYYWPKISRVTKTPNKNLTIASVVAEEVR